MKYNIEKQSPTRHRNTTFSEYIDVRSGQLCFDDVEVIVVKFDCDQKWWIIPSSYDDDEALGDTGPYEELDDALLMLRLLGEN